METRSSYFLVGLFVLLSMIGLLAFGAWLAKSDIDKQFNHFEIAFSGSVGGLQEGSQVQYRGVPVGRVQKIGIDPANITQILAVIEVDAETPVKEDTSVQLALQGITGIANIELLGGSNESSALKPSDDGKLPRLKAAQSAIEKVFQSTPELLAHAVSLLEQLTKLTSKDNVDAVTRILGNVEKLTVTLDDSSGDLSTMLSEAALASKSISAAAEDSKGLITEYTSLAETLSEQVTAIATNTEGTLGEIDGAAVALKNLAWRLDRTFESVERPLDDFTQSGLYDFTEMVRELRQLVTSLSRISKEFERDPAGFLIGGNQRGFTPE